MQKEKGFATIVFVMLVGLAITATGAGVMHTVNGAQQKNIAINSVTHSQTGVWVGAEAFRLYLTKLDTAGILLLAEDLAIDMDPSYGALAASNILIDDLGTGTFRVSAQIVNTHAAARSSAALNVVYEVEPSDAAGASSATDSPITAIDFNDDLSLNGGFELIGTDGNTFDLNVNGDVDLGGLSVNPLGTISATGKVTIGSSVVVENIYANDDVELANTDVQTVSTLGDFTATGSASVYELRANGDIEINASGRFENVYSLQNISILTAGGSGHGYVNAGQTISVNNAGPVDRVEAVGDINLQTWSTISDSVSMSDITCVSQYWKNFDSLSANGSLNSCSGTNSSGSNEFTTSGAANTVVTMVPLLPYSQTESTIDVWSMRDSANYIVSYDDIEQHIKVEVTNITGLSEDSEYFIGNYLSYNGSSYRDYLCTSVDASGNCTAPTVPLIPLCTGQSFYNGCITYTSDDDTFTINPNTTAPGIMWFDGNLKLGNGFGVTTYLATGDIETFGSFESWSANFSGYDKTCLADASHIDDTALQERYTSNYSVHYPDNLCDLVNDEYISTTVGNIGLAAGGIDPDGDGSYEGGDIKLGASSEITGAVLAGNLLETTGETTVYGVVASASGNGSSESDGNQLGGKTTIDLSKGTSTYDPTNIPDMTSTSNETSSNADSVARMLWVQYM